MSVNLLFENAHLLAVDKPAGLATIPEGWERQAPHLRGLLETEYGKVWIVHRLDKVTSGVIVFARDAETHRVLSLLFESRAVHKVYHALVTNTPNWEERTARHRLRPGVGRPQRTVVDHARGQSAETGFRVGERFASAALLEAIPASGRTHQIRAHAAALGLPLLGDSLYGAPPTEIINRPALHAYRLAFEFDGQPLAFSAPYPKDFETALKKLKAGR
ncbi:MAG: RluA family pseudouridine synthase [Anaerolineales bacterium]|nr:RluA family pseudouridine synthase [Anaerolineales bacterium]